MPIIEFLDVTKIHENPQLTRPALSNVSFALQPGEFSLVMGPTGAGKTTLLKLLLAMERPDTGTVRVAGRDIGRLKRDSIPYLRRDVAAVFQDVRLLLDVSPLDNVALALEVLGMRSRDVRKRAKQSLEDVGLPSDIDKPVHRLSGGERQRVAIARAIASEPAVILADEPTAMLDPMLARDILELLARVNRRGTTIVLATRDPHVARNVDATRLLMLRDGCLDDSEGLLGRADVDAEDPLVAYALDQSSIGLPNYGLPNYPVGAVA